MNSCVGLLLLNILWDSSTLLHVAVAHSFLLLNSIQLYDYATIYPFFYPFIYVHLGYFQVWTFMNIAPVGILVPAFGEHIH